MDIFYFVIILILIYFINPLKNPEKLLLTPPITISYIVIMSYILSNLNIPINKIFYLIPLFIMFIYRLRSIKIEDIIPKFDYKKYLYLILILLFAIYLGYSIFPENPGNTTDIQFHSYKTKAMMEDNTIFYKTDKIPYSTYVNYPAGTHSVIYLLSSKISEILNSIQFLKFYILILFVLGYYLLGGSIKKGMGNFTALFLPLINMPYLILSTLIPNMLGYSMMLFSMYLLLQYITNKKKIYLLFFIILTSSMALIHTFPIIILSLFLLSLTIYYLILKKYKLIVSYWISFIISMLFAFSMVFTKMAKTVVSYGTSLNIHPEPMIKIVHNILAGLGIIYLYIWLNMSKDPTGNINTFLVSLVFTFLLILGIYNFIKNKINYGIPFIVLLIFLILNIIFLKVLCIPIPIPFFNHQYDSARMALHLQAIMPLFYGSGLYYLYRKVETIRNNINIYNLLKPLFIASIILFSLFSAHTNYEILKERGKNIYVMDDNDLKVFDWIDRNNISNKRILNFGEDAGQYLPIYTTNEPVYTFYRFASGNSTFGGLSFKELVSSVDNKNYTKFIEACRRENINYIYLSEKMGKYDGGFFNNSKYFEILYQVGNAKIVKIKGN
ncbi:hypothetical protein KKP91_01160 [Methanothermococcus sp. SCGC AD-155-M21]|nr:hypothetical protein [Methanothermococcus sp. SCGC AD-155-M21]